MYDHLDMERVISDALRPLAEKEREDAIQRVFQRYGADLHAFVDQVEHEKASELLERACDRNKNHSQGLDRASAQ